MTTFNSSDVMGVDAPVIEPGILSRQLLRLPFVHWDPPEPQAAVAKRGKTKSGEDDLPPLHTARAELVLARDSRNPLARLGIDDDPLHEIARALTGLSSTRGRESFEFHLDLLPITDARKHHIKNKIIRAEGDAARSSERPAGGGLRDGLRTFAYGIDSASSRTSPGRSTPRRLTPLERTAINTQARDLGGKILQFEEAWFELQLLLIARSPQRGRAEERIQMVTAKLEQFADENSFKVYGQRFGPFYLGSDLPGRRQRFDRRVRTGLFLPSKSGWVTAGEIAGFLKPPTKNLQITNIARGGGPVPPPDKNLPTYRGPIDRHLLPMGWIREDHGYGWRPVGVPLEDTFFELLTGKSRSGKSERMAAQFVHLALAGYGGMYLDPHIQAIERIKPYLGSVADRILEFNLSKRQTSMQAGFNLLSMTGRTRADIEGRISAVVSAFSAALSWSNVNNRAQNLVTQAVWSLCEIGLLLPPELQPTIFQIITILSDEEWRSALLPHLPKDVASFWTTRFNNLEKSAITPVTNLLDRLRSSPSVAALLGSSESTYDARRAMDEGKIILASPAGTGDKDKFLASFFLYDVFLAALSRQDSGKTMDQLRTFHLAVDEQQIYDTAGSVLELMLRETAKYGLKVFGATQSLTVLQKATQDMWLTNRSHVITSAERHDAAKILSKEMGDLVEPRTITGLDRFCSIGQLTLNKKTTRPFWMRGFDLTDLYSEYHDEGAPDKIATAVDKNLGRKPVAQTLADLRELDDRIAAFLSAHIPRARTEARGPQPASEPAAGAPRPRGKASQKPAAGTPDNVTELKPRSTKSKPGTRWE